MALMAAAPTSRVWAPASRVATFNNERDQAGMVAQAVAGFCVETFLLNCTMAGQPANCQQVINMGSSKIEIR